MKIRLSRENAYLTLVSLCFAFTSIRLFFGALSFYVTGNDAGGKALFYVFLLICSYFAMPYFANVITLKSVGLFSVWCGYCYICARLAQLDSILYVNEIKYILTFGCLYFFIGKSICYHKEIVKAQLYKLPIVLNIIGVFNLILLGTAGEKISTSVSRADYSMELSYANLAAAMICTVLFISGELENLGFLHEISKVKETRMILLLNLPVSYLLVLLGGSRGPLLALMLIAIFSSLYSFLHRKNLIAIAFLFFSGCIGLIFIFSGAGSVFLNSGVRSLSMLADNNLLEMSGREHYYAAAIKGVWENKLCGTGVFRDRVYIFKEFHRYRAQNSYGSYPHNIILEVLLQFGIPIGSFLLYSFGHKIKRAWILFKTAHAQEVFLFLVGIGLFPLIVSKSYVHTWEFYMLVGLLAECKKSISSAA